MATVVKNFRIKQGLVVEGSTGTINGQNILTETGGDAYILNLVGGTNLINSVESTQMEVIAGELNIKSGVFDTSGAAAAAQSAAEATASADATSKANAAQSAATTAAATDATTKVAAEAALRVSGDAASVATAAADATSKANAAQSAATTAAASDATTKANAAQAAAEATAAAALSTAISTEVSNRNTAISTAVDSLVDGAPALLNTLNELAAAINDDANYTTTITTALGTKAPLASPDLTGVPTAPTAAADTNTTQIATTAFAKGEADAAQSAAASDATTKANAAQAAAESTAAAANTAQQNGTTAFTAINYNSVAKQVAATTGNIVTAAATTALSWVAADYRSAKLVVKAKNGSHTQVSDLVVTLDTSNNVAVSEYGITYSNGTELAAITADYSGSDVRIRVTPANNNTEVVVVGTLIK